MTIQPKTRIPAEPQAVPFSTIESLDIDRSNGPRRGWVYLVAIIDPPGDPADLLFSSSPDNGQTWTAPVRINNDAPGAGHWQWFSTMAVALRPSPVSPTTSISWSVSKSRFNPCRTSV